MICVRVCLRVWALLNCVNRNTIFIPKLYNHTHMKQNVKVNLERKRLYLRLWLSYIITGLLTLTLHDCSIPERTKRVLGRTFSDSYI